MIKYGLLILFVVFGVLSSQAQQERKFIREGNELFEKQDFEKAEVEYRKAADKKNESFEAAFNMADALYKQKKYDEALQQFSALAKQQTDKQRLGEIYHNIGNTLLSMEKTEESIEAYKESLRNRPDSEQTKYNLEFARHKQQQDNKDQNQDQNKDQNKDQNQDQNKDQQNQDQNKDQKDQNQDQKDQDQQNQDQNKDQKDQNQDQKDQDQQNKDQNQDQQEQNKDQKDQKKDQQDQNKDQQNKDRQDRQDQKDRQPQEGKISKEDAERLLEALQNDEKDVQEKVQKQKAQEQKAKRMKIDKNW